MKDITFKKPLQESDYQAYDEWCEWCNIHNYSIMDDNDEYYYCKDNNPTQQDIISTQINKLKQQLSDTDYKAIKYMEGYISEEDYSSIKQQRQSWRDEINSLEQQIEKLNTNS